MNTAIQTRPVLDWLKELPEEYRDKAIRNCMAHRTISAPILQASSKKNALYFAFDWAMSPEGRLYWITVAQSL